MRKKTTLPLAALGLTLAIAGCGSSSSVAPGVVTAPSAGSTSESATVASVSSSTTTTSATSTSTIPLPAALKARPKVTIPSGAAPTKLVVQDIIKGEQPLTRRLVRVDRMQPWVDDPYQAYTVVEILLHLRANRPVCVGRRDNLDDEIRRHLAIAMEGSRRLIGGHKRQIW